MDGLKKSEDGRKEKGREGRKEILLPFKIKLFELEAGIL